MNDETTAYTVTRRRQQRRLILRVRPDGSVTVSAPAATGQREIDAFVASRSAWIARQRAAIEEGPRQIERNSAEFTEHKRGMMIALDDLMPLWCERLGIATPPRVTVKVMSTRWGSCNAHLNKINLNVELARRGRDAIEYVLVHELAHLFHQNHGPGFYALMDAQLPDWKARRKGLRRV